GPPSGNKYDTLGYGLFAPFVLRQVAVGETHDSRINASLQRHHDLAAEHTRLLIYRNAGTPAEQERKRKQIEENRRLAAEIEKNELDGYERVATDATEPCFEEDNYAIKVTGKATHDIRANELLLLHADGVFRTMGTFPKLTTTGRGWYFRPDRAIPRGKWFVAKCIQDAPEEIENVKRGFMPGSSRARDPARAYRTQVELLR
ncbi:MAG: hypothetical protein JW741_11070, partial [Sedimentisphaerales bacterium]|nr:hypothetical protein [Sedimentisphaerales bacterium]